jgi:hypothetical protein
MRRTFKLAGAAAAFAWSLSGTAFAGQGTAGTTGEMQALLEARDELASRAAQTKGAPRAQYDLERQRVDSLIDALEHGQRVSPSEVEKALDEAHRASPW